MVDVHRDDRQRDRCAGRRIELCSDKSHAIASLGQAESPFYFDTIRVIQIGSFPFLVAFLSGTPQCRSGYSNPVFFAERTVLSVSVYLIDKNAFRIVSSAVVVFFDCVDQYISFTVCIEGQPFQSCKPAFIDAHVELGAEFNRGFCFPSHDRSDVRLADTDDTVFDAVCAILVHVLLLLKHLSDDLKPTLHLI